MSYDTYDTKEFTEQDYVLFASLPGFSCRDSVAQGTRNRGKLVSVNRLMRTQEEVIQMIPKGYTLVPSDYKSSTACIVKETPERQQAELLEAENAKVEAVQRELSERGEQAALTLFANMTIAKVITKRQTVLTCLTMLLNAANETHFSRHNILDVYQAIPVLQEIYFDNPKKQKKLQELFDKLITRQISLSDITNSFDMIYLNGLMQLLNIPLHH